MNEPRTGLPTIMLVDNEPDDIFLLTRSLQKAGLRNPLLVARDGKEAICHLSRVVAGTADFESPVLILTDLNMPHCDGWALLTWIKSQPALSSILVVAVSSSQRDEDLARASRAGCYSVLKKHPSPEECATIYAAAEVFAANSKRPPQS